MNPLQPTPPTVGALTSVIRGYGQLGIYIAEALDMLNNLATADRRDELAAGRSGSQSILPIVIKDPNGDVVGILGYAGDGSLANYGLSTYDLTGNQGTLVGIQLEVPLPITAATNASPTVVTVPGNTYANNNTILISGEPSNTAINGERILIDSGVGGAGTFHITDLAGNLINGNGGFAGPATAQRYFSGVYIVTGNVRTAIDNQQPSGGPAGNAVSGGVGVQDIANGAQATLGPAFVVMVNKNGKPCASMAVLDVTNPASAGILRVFDGSGTGQFGSGQTFFYDSNALAGQARGQFTVQVVGGATYARLAEIGNVSGADANGAWSVDSTNGLQLRGTQRNSGIGDGFLHALSIGAFGVVIATSGDANFKTVSVDNGGSPRLVITNDGTVNATGAGGLEVNGTTHIDSSGNVSSANGFNGSFSYVKTISINFAAQTFSTTNGTATVVNGIVTSAT